MAWDEKELRAEIVEQFSIYGANDIYEIEIAIAAKRAKHTAYVKAWRARKSSDKEWLEKRRQYQAAYNQGYRARIKANKHRLELEIQRRRACYKKKTKDSAWLDKHRKQSLDYYYRVKK